MVREPDEVTFMEDDEAGFQLAIKAITGLMVEQRRTQALLRMQSQSTEALSGEVSLMGDGVVHLKEQVDALSREVGSFGHRVGSLSGQVQGLHRVQLGLVDSSERSLEQQQMLLEAMTGFASTSTRTQKRLARVEEEIEELKRRFPEAS